MLFSIDFLQLFTLANVLGQKRSNSCDLCRAYWSLKKLFKAQCKSYLYNLYFELRNQNKISINYKLDGLSLNFLIALHIFLNCNLKTSKPIEGKNT